MCEDWVNYKSKSEEAMCLIFSKEIPPWYSSV